jgi:hypothetical protein
VESFDNEEFLLETVMGMLSVRGENLQMKNPLHHAVPEQKKNLFAHNMNSSIQPPYPRYF